MAFFNDFGRFDYANVLLCKYLCSLLPEHEILKQHLTVSYNFINNKLFNLYARIYKLANKKNFLEKLDIFYHIMYSNVHNN